MNGRRQESKGNGKGVLGKIGGDATGKGSVASSSVAHTVGSARVLRIERSPAL